MFDVSTGELIVLAAATMAFVGRNDVPHAFRVLGTGLGRIVGFAQGVRAKAEQFTHQASELQGLQRELRSSLRDLDVVRSEMTSATSPRNMFGRGLLSNTAQVVTNNKNNHPLLSSHSTYQPPTHTQELSSQMIQTTGLESMGSSVKQPGPTSAAAAVAEEMWEMEGIGFKSKAERGVGLGRGQEALRKDASPGSTGSEILSRLLQEQLIYEQYDRMIQQQEEILQNPTKKVPPSQKKPN